MHDSDRAGSIRRKSNTFFSPPKTMSHDIQRQDRSEDKSLCDSCQSPPYDFPSSEMLVDSSKSEKRVNMCHGGDP